MRRVIRQIDDDPSMEDLSSDWLATFMMNVNLLDEDPSPLLIMDGNPNQAADYPNGRH